MFPAADSNSFTAPYSDQVLFYSSNLLDSADIDVYNYYKPYSPFSFDQNITHPILFPSDEQQVELQNSLMVQHQEEEPMLTDFGAFTMADTRSNAITSMRAGYCTMESFNHSGLAILDQVNGSNIGAVGHMQIDKVSKNLNVSKKDRHSKINTAQGPRDRRMRLSLDIAKRFFGLQDMLGFDKASKTVDWLLSKSQPEINKVTNSNVHDGNHVATSDSFGAYECCEEVSEVVNKDEVSLSEEILDTNKGNKKISSKKKGGMVSVSLREGFNSLSKESREKARARARERTKEKMMICTSQKYSKQNENVYHFSNMDQNMINQVKKLDFLNLGPHAYSYVDQGHTMNNPDDSLASTSHWINPSSSTFNNLQQQFGTETSHQFPFDDTQIYAKPWETYN